MVLLINVHGGDIIMSTKALQITNVRFVTQPFVQAKVEESLKRRVTGLC